MPPLPPVPMDEIRKLIDPDAKEEEKEESP